MCRRLELERKRHEEAERKRREHEEALARQRAEAELKVGRRGHVRLLADGSLTGMARFAWSSRPLCQRQAEQRKLRERQLQQLEQELLQLQRETEQQTKLLEELRARHDQEADVIRSIQDRAQVLRRPVPNRDPPTLASALAHGCAQWAVGAPIRHQELRRAIAGIDEEAERLQVEQQEAASRRLQLRQQVQHNAAALQAQLEVVAQRRHHADTLASAGGTTLA